MDNKTFIAAYVAQESTRLRDALADLVKRAESPSEEEKEALMHDMQATLGRLQAALLEISHEMQKEQEYGETAESPPCVH